MRRMADAESTRAELPLRELRLELADDAAREGFPLSLPALREVAYDELEHVRVTRDFLNAPDRFLRQL